MKKIFIFGLLIGAIVIIIGVIVQFNLFLDSQTEVINVVDIDSAILPRDTTIIPNGLTEEEFIMEMQKGVNGDYTQEQVDSMRSSWAEQDYNFEN